MKLKSNHILIGISTIATILIFLYASAISKNIEEAPYPSSKIWYLGKGAYFKDTLKGRYRHLVTDFPLIELNPHTDQEVEIEA